MLRGWREQVLAEQPKIRLVAADRRRRQMPLRGQRQCPFIHVPGTPLLRELAALVLQLVASRHGRGALGDQGTSSWLFPGGQPGRPLSAYQLGERLRQLGLRPGQARSTALFQLATELPAALRARLLGIHISVAIAWQRASSGDWTNYAADYSRRQPAVKPITHNVRGRLS